jgi:pyridoxal phosphate enzyme (YggS family)
MSPAWTDPPDAAVVAERIGAVRTRIRAAGGDPDAVTIVAVTKTFGPAAIAAAVAAGCPDIGENYAQEALAKVDAVAACGARLHFIGRLQSNKVRALAPHVALWQSLDRPSVIDEVARWAPGAAVLVQVDLSGAAGRGGCAPDDVDALVARARRAGLVVRGLMGVAPLGSPDDARPGFAALRAACDRLELPVCSMGMTDDLEVAVEEGSTMVRIGSAVFGRRDAHSA